MTVQVDNLNMAQSKVLNAIDPSALEEIRTLQVEGEEDLVQKIISLFCKTAPLQITKIKVAIQTKDFHTLMLEAHSLKSSSAQVGAVKMQGYCKKLEEIGRAASDQDNSILSLTNELESEFKGVEAELRLFR